MMTRDLRLRFEAIERRAAPRQRIAALLPSPAWLVVVLIVVGAVTRFYHLGSRNLWLDETYALTRSPLVHADAGRRDGQRHGDHQSHHTREEVCVVLPLPVSRAAW
jgi:hypothetical protein